MSQQCDGYSEIYNKRAVTARKPHVCCACKENILVGERYLYVFMVFDGNADTFKRCLRCEAIHAHLVDRCREQQRKYGDLIWPDEALNCGADYEDHWGEPPPPEIAELAFKNGHVLQGSSS